MFVQQRDGRGDVTFDFSIAVVRSPQGWRAELQRRIRPGHAAGVDGSWFTSTSAPYAGQQNTPWSRRIESSCSTALPSGPRSDKARLRPDAIACPRSISGNAASGGAQAARPCQFDRAARAGHQGRVNASDVSSSESKVLAGQSDDEIASVHRRSRLTFRRRALDRSPGCIAGIDAPDKMSFFVTSVATGERRESRRPGRRRCALPATGRGRRLERPQWRATSAPPPEGAATGRARPRPDRPKGPWFNSRGVQIAANSRRSACDQTDAVGTMTVLPETAERMRVPARHPDRIKPGWHPRRGRHDMSQLDEHDRLRDVRSQRPPGRARQRPLLELRASVEGCTTAAFERRAAAASSTASRSI